MRRSLFVLSIVASVGLGCGLIPESDVEDDEEIETTPEEELPDGVGQLLVDGIGALPDVTDPVALNEDAESEAVTLDSDSGSLDIATSDFSLRADSGISLDTASQSSLEAFGNASYGACELVNRTRGFLHFAASSDELECQLAAIAGGVDKFYDGEFHVVDLVDDGEVVRFRFKFEGERDAVTGLTAQVCFDGTQETYLKKTIVDGVATIYAKHFTKPDNPQVDEFRNVVKVTGEVDSDGDFNDVKKIISDYSNVFSDGRVSYVKEIVRQSSANVQYTGVVTEEGRDPSRFLSFFNLIDANESDTTAYDIGNLSIGSGAFLFAEDGEDPVAQAWGTSDFSVDTDLTILGKVSGRKGDLPSTPKKVDLEFAADEAFDCGSAEAEYSVKIELIEKRLGLALEGDHGEGGHGEGGHGDEEEDEPLFCGNYSLPQNSHIECRDFDKSGQ